MVGDDEVLGGSGDGDVTAMVGPVVIRADQDQVPQFGGAAVFPVADVVGVQPAGGAAARDHTAAVAVFEGAAQPATHGAGGPTAADDLAVAFEPDLAGGVAGQVAALVVGEQRSQVQGRDARLEVEMHDDGGALPVRTAGSFGVPAELDEPHEPVHGVREGWRLLATTVGVAGVVVFPVGDQCVAV